MKVLWEKTCGDCRKQFTATTNNEKFCMRCLAQWRAKLTNDDDISEDDAFYRDNEHEAF
jgi:rRNA maturation endonuclease Nob1